MSRRFLFSVALVLAIVISTSALLPLPVTPQDEPGSTDDQIPVIISLNTDRKMHALVDKSAPLVNTPAVWQLKDSEGDYVTGKGVVVAVFDTGVNYSLLKSIAPDATLLAYNVLEPSESGTASGDTSDLIAGINRAVNDNADIMCMSFGISGQGPSPIESAVDAAVSDGVTVVAAAGNDGPYIGTIASPADYKNVIAVGALEEERDVATVEVIPKNKILHADVMDYSPLTNVSGELVFAGLGHPENFTYRSFNGTIALIKRGELYFYEKVRNAYDAGAIGVVIFNNMPGNFSGTLMNES